MAATESEARKTRQPYRCFLVRCRLEEGAGPSGEPAWRFTVQQPGRGAGARPFAWLNDVTAYIDAELASCSSPKCGKPKSEFRNSVQHIQESEYKE